MQYSAFTTIIKRGKLWNRSCSSYQAASMVHHRPPLIKKGFQKGHVQQYCMSGSAHQRGKSKRCDIRPGIQWPTVKYNNELCVGQNGKLPTDPLVALRWSDVSMFKHIHRLSFMDIEKKPTIPATGYVLLFCTLVSFDLLTDLNPTAEVRTPLTLTPFPLAPVLNNTLLFFFEDLKLTNQ